MHYDWGNFLMPNKAIISRQVRQKIFFQEKLLFKILKHLI